MRKILLINSNRASNLLAKHLLEEAGISHENICLALNKREAESALDKLKKDGEKSLVIISSAIYNTSHNRYESTIPLIKRASVEEHRVVLYTGRKEQEILDLMEVCRNLGVPYRHRTLSSVDNLYDFIKPYIED